jgi:hypothetical protein
MSLKVDNARMFPHGFGRILLGQSVYTVVGIVLQSCTAMDKSDRERWVSRLHRRWE